MEKKMKEGGPNWKHEKGKWPCGTVAEASTDEKIHSSVMISMYGVQKET